jgi:hypothetical protein
MFCYSGKKHRAAPLNIMKFTCNRFSHEKTRESLMDDLDKILGDLDDVENDIISLYKSLSRICRALEEESISFKREDNHTKTSI